MFTLASCAQGPVVSAAELIRKVGQSRFLHGILGASCVYPLGYPFIQDTSWHPEVDINGSSKHSETSSSSNPLYPVTPCSEVAQCSHLETVILS